jgi:pimeloyl-ACP methyl ester carboxylesterase
MKLIVLPGGGSPDNELYSKVYNLLGAEAINFGYEYVDTSLRWPGHSNKKGIMSGKLTLDGAMEIAVSTIQEYEDKGKEYDLLGRSFGTIVATKYAIAYKPKSLRKIILWGPPPYWLLWQMFFRDIDTNSKIAAGKGLYLDDTFFPSIVPIESMIPILDNHTVIATGTKDPYSKPSFISYLWNCVSHKINFSFRIVEGAIHEVTYETSSPDVVRAYLEALFK